MSTEKEEIEVVKTELEAKALEINEKMDGFEKEIADIKEIAEKNEGNVPEELGQKMDKLETEAKDNLTEYKDLYEKSETLVSDMQGQIDGLDVKLQRKGTGEETLSDHVKSIVAEKQEDLELMAKGQGAPSVTLRTKADVTLSSNFTNEVIDRDRIPGVWFDAERAVHVRDFMNVTQTNTDVLRWISESAYTDNAANVSEGSASTQTDFTLKSNDETIRKIATHLTVSREMLMDAPFTENYIRTRVFAKIMKQEDDQILNGDNVAPNLNGLKNQAQAYVDIIEDSKVHRIDVMSAAGTGARVDEYIPNIALIHPNDYDEILRTKDGNDAYVMPNIFTGQPVVINGSRVVPNTSVTDGDFFVGDLLRAATLAVRTGIEMRFTDSHASNFTKDFVTIQVEERIGMAVYQAKALVYGTFTAAIGDGTA